MRRLDDFRDLGIMGNPFQTKQGNRPSCLEQEGRRCSDEVVREPRCSCRVRPANKQIKKNKQCLTNKLLETQMRVL